MVLALFAAAPACGGDDISGPGRPGDPGVPALLRFQAAPEAGELGTVLTPAVRVEILDAAGDRVDSATAAVTLSLAANPGRATLGGATTVTAVDGVATFDDLVLDHSGSGYLLEANSGSLHPAISPPFDIAFTFVEVSAGYFHSCGVTPDGAAYCWGIGSFRLGSADDDASAAPVRVEGEPSFRTIDVALNHTCGLTSERGGHCWGFNASGPLGDGTEANSSAPVPVEGGLTFRTLAAAGFFTCGLTDEGAAHCWGANDYGQLGDGTETDRSVPVPVAGGLPFDTITTGVTHACGLTSLGAAYCWGNNARGQLGDGDPGDRSLEPVRVQTALVFQALSAGGRHTCGLTSDGAAYCWGENVHGQLGDGTETQRNTPVPVLTEHSFRMITAGGFHTCGVADDDSGHCWGLNEHAQLGNGTVASDSVPGPIHGGIAFHSLDAGGLSSHTCGLATDGTPYCWGRNFYGQLGDGTTGGIRTVPVRVVDPEA